MVTDQQVRRLFMLIHQEPTLARAAAKAGMDEKTARKYRRLGKLPSEVKPEHTWRTRKDPFADVWHEVRSKLVINPGLQAKTLFLDLQRRYPGRFADGQLRTLQRRVKHWRAVEGPPKEVFFPQYYISGERCQSDFTSMNALGITIQGQVFDHLVYHYVLPYSNWETGRICFSESFESLSEGLQSALFELGGVPKMHQTYRMTAAVQKARHPDEFTDRYEALLRHYRMEGRKTQAASPHENGDVEQRHYRFKDALEQSLLMRGSRDFDSREQYAAFLGTLFDQLNQDRRERFQEEIKALRQLPLRRLQACKRLTVRVASSSTISVKRNLYSVPSRLIGERVEVRLYAEHLDVWYAQRLQERLPRLRGVGKHRIDYRHIIDWLVRKPGAFAHYRYRSDLFPTHRFRMAYDLLHRQGKPDKTYLHLLWLAAREGEVAVDAALRQLINQGKGVSSEAVEACLESGRHPCPVATVTIPPVDLCAYDALLMEALSC